MLTISVWEVEYLIIITGQFIAPACLSVIIRDLIGGGFVGKSVQYVCHTNDH